MLIFCLSTISHLVLVFLKCFWGYFKLSRCILCIEFCFEAILPSNGSLQWYWWIAWVQHSWWEVQHKPFTLFFSFLAQNCSGLRTCSQCLEQPECGWCGDPSSTGKGLCMEGSYRGPMKRPAKQGQQSQQSQDMSLEPGSCPKDKGYEWAFIHCPGKGIHFLFSLLKWQSVIWSVSSWEIIITYWLS